MTILLFLLALPFAAAEPLVDVGPVEISNAPGEALRAVQAAFKAGKWQTGAPPRVEVPLLGLPHVEPLPPNRTLPELIRDKMETLRPQIGLCQNQWLNESPVAPARLVLELSFGPTGLERVYLLQTTEAPPVVLDCIGNALSTMAWPPVAEPTIVNWPYRFGA